LLRKSGICKGLVYTFKSDNQLALYHLHQALDIETKLHGNDNNTNISKILGHIGLTHLHDGNTEKALEYFQHALSIEQRLLPCEHIYIALRFEDIGLCYELRMEYALALEYYQRALNIVDRILPISHKRRRQILKGILDTLYKSGAYSKAIEFANSILDNDTTIFKGWTIVRLSELFLKINDSNTAYKYFQDASIFYEKNRSNNSSVISTLKQKLNELEPSFLSITGDKINF
jgi:tetratricopeptide (TPR) repeat protein